MNGWINYENELNNARKWVAERTDHFYQQVAQFYGRGTPTPLTVNKEVEADQLDGVTITMNNIQLSQPLFDGKFYMGRTVTLKATGGQHPVKGWKVVQKNEDGTTTEQTVDGAQYSFSIPSCQSLAVNALLETTGISNASLNNNEQRINNKWFTIDGRQLNGYPQQRGIYIYNGRKVVVDATH